MSSSRFLIAPEGATKLVNVGSPVVMVLVHRLADVMVVIAVTIVVCTGAAGVLALVSVTTVVYSHGQIICFSGGRSRKNEPSLWSSLVLA
jgi:hypothetical protein